MAAEEYPENDERYLIHVPAKAADGTQRILKNGDSFAVFDEHGDIPGRGAGVHGIYHDGTRFLCGMRLFLAGAPPLLLGSAVRDDDVLLVVDLTNPDHSREDRLIVPHGALHVMRSKFLVEGRCYEQIRVTNFGESTVELELALAYDADFHDLFEVRGTRRERRGRMMAPVLSDDRVGLGYCGLDDRQRSTWLDFSPAPARLDRRRAAYDLSLQPKQSALVSVVISCTTSDDPPELAAPFEDAYGEVMQRIGDYQARVCSIQSSSLEFNEWVDRAGADLRMMITDTKYGPYPYAGVPWFSTPFGRDGIITALQSLWLHPELAYGVLRFLAAHQATSVDESADAEPGKILHEMRSGEMAAMREIPFGCYYGSVDSTALFLVLLAEYYRVTGDRELVTQLWPNVERALEWIDRYGDLDGDGFVEYGRRSRDGLVQQGWKDSHDSVFHADGRPARGPIALAEVQGYVYAAKRGIAEIAAMLGDVSRADRLAREAEALRQRFEEAFWCEDLGTYALALDGEKQPCRVRSSNPGHCLATGIVSPQRAKILADRLLDDDMFSGWGIRTLSASEQRYNPLSYHNGSVWPHDNALIVAGLARYGFKNHALRVFEGMFDASQSVDLNRLPELFCGFVRRRGEGPTAYPGACTAQAWSATAVFYMLQALLGLTIDGRARRVCFMRPVLPHFVGTLRIDHIRVGPHRVSVELHRYPDDVGLNVVERDGPVEVVSIK